MPLRPYPELTKPWNNPRQKILWAIDFYDMWLMMKDDDFCDANVMKNNTGNILLDSKDRTSRKICILTNHEL